MVTKSNFIELELMQARIKAVPVGWDFARVGQTFSIKNNFRKPISEDEREKNPGVYPYYGPTKIQGYIGTYEQDGSYALIGEDGDHFLKYDVNPMTQLVDGKCTVNNHAHIIEGTGKATREWFYYYFMHRDIFSFLSRQGAGRYKLNKAALEKIPLLVPPMQEQKKIVQILSTWDKAIALNERLLALAMQQKKALMQQLLTGKKRFPGFVWKWQTKNIGEIGEIKSAGVDKKIIDGEVPTRLLNYTDVFKKSFIYSSDLNHWVTAPASKIEGCDVRRGDVFFTPSSETRGDAGISAVAAEDIEQCCYSYHVVRFRIKEKWDLNFKAYAFTTTKFRDQAVKLADGSGQRYVISQDSFRGVEVTYPDYEEQVKIGAAIKTAEDEEQVWMKKIILLKQEKKALMQQLLTGKRRVLTDEVVI